MKTTGEMLFAVSLTWVLGCSDPGVSQGVATTNEAFQAALPVYNGGLMLNNVRVVSVMWGPNVDPQVATGMASFYEGVTNSDWFDSLDEYGFPGRLIGRGSLLETVTISPQNTSSALSNAAIGQELSTQINLRVLPVPDANTVYQIHFPPGVTIDGTCSNGVVAFHSYVRVPLPPHTVLNVPYSVLPDMVTHACVGQGFRALTQAASHELAEAVADPFFNAWNPEVVDPCGGPADIRTPTGNHAVEQIYSATLNNCVAGPPATIGVVNSNLSWQLTNTFGGDVQFAFQYGGSSWKAVTGNWDGGNERTIGVFEPSSRKWYLRFSNTGGDPDITPFAYGGVGDRPVVGDWDGDGTETIGVFRPSNRNWLLRNSNTPGDPSITSFPYGAAGEIPVVGDWNGDGVTTIGTFRPSDSTWRLRNSNTPGTPDMLFSYGQAGDIPVVGKWGGRFTGIGVYRQGTWLLKTLPGPGDPDIVFAYGASSDLPVVGPWRRN